MGRNIKLTKNRVVEIMQNANRPVWTVTKMAEHANVTRATANKRLKALADAGELETVQVGNATAYFIPGIETKPVGDSVELLKRDLRRSYEDEFVGLPNQPWTAVHPNDGIAEGGDRIQLEVEGSPADWTVFGKRLYEDRRQNLLNGETPENQTQALISGELYEKPTVPIEHIDYPDDYDLKRNLGAEFRGEPPNQALIAAGVKNYLIRPCDDAVFLQNVEVEWLCPEGEVGPEHESNTPGRGMDRQDPVHSEEVQEKIDELADEVDGLDGLPEEE